VEVGRIVQELALPFISFAFGCVEGVHQKRKSLLYCDIRFVLVSRNKMKLKSHQDTVRKCAKVKCV
jgi:hypothetical protein